MSSGAVYLRLRATDPSRWQAVAAAWRRWAALAGQFAAELPGHAARLAAVWSGAAAMAAAARLALVRRGLTWFRVLCWQADQAVSEFASALGRARVLLARARAAASRGGLTIDDDGKVVGGAAPAVTADLSAAVSMAARADATASARLAAIGAAVGVTPQPPGPGRPSCTASAAEVRRWWSGLSAAQRSWLLVAEPGWLAPLDGIPAADRDAANRLVLDDRRDELDRAIAGARGHERDRLRAELRGLNGLADRLAGTDGPRAYLLRLDLAGEGRVVVALGDPDRADNVLTHVPGVTSDLASFARELSPAERVAARSAELGPGKATSTVLWLGYDAPDSLGEAMSARQADAGASALRSFQDGLRATHLTAADHQTVLGHSYGSLVVGKAAAGPGMAADDVVFVGSPGVGVESAGKLHVPAGHVWSSTSRTDIIEYAALSPRALLPEIPMGGLLPLALPGHELWFGHNPSDPAFGAHVFASQADAGHLGYWDEGKPALDAMTAITLGSTP